MKKYQYIALLLISLPLLKAMSPEETEHYTTKYAITPELKEKLDKSAHTLWPEFGKDKETSVAEITISPGVSFFAKKELDRLKGKDTIDRIALEQGCPGIITPPKYIYTPPSDPNNPVVVAQEIKFAQGIPFNEDQIKQICTVLLKSGYIDTHSDNIRQTMDGKVAFIDTEMRGFFNSPDCLLSINPSPNLSFQPPNKYEAINYALKGIYERWMTDKARAYMQQVQQENRKAQKLILDN